MDWVKLFAAIIITAATFGIVALVAWLVDLTNWRIFLVIMVVAMVGLVYCCL